MTYVVGQNGTGQGDVDSDATLRDYWTRSYDGLYRLDFDAGITLGKSDITTDATTGYDALIAVEHSARDLHWHAKADGYRVATIDRGGSLLGADLRPRFVEAQPIHVGGRRVKNQGPFGAFRS